MDCRTTAAYRFRTRLGINHYDVMLTKEQSVLAKIKSSEKMQAQDNLLVCRTYFLNFHDFKLAVEIDKNGHSNKNIDYEIRRQKALS